MQEEDNASSPPDDDSWDEPNLPKSLDEPHVPTLSGIGVAAPASVRGSGDANDPEQMNEAELSPAARERRRKKKLAQQKAAEEKRAFAAAQQKKKIPAAEKAKARGKSVPPSAVDEERSPTSSVRPTSAASKRPERTERASLAPSQVRKIEKEERLRSQTKMLFGFAALVLALIAIGFYLH